MGDLGSEATRFGLPEVLQQLGTELNEAQELGGDVISWMTATVELELAAEATVGGGLKFWVLNADAAATETRTTRISVQLTPKSGEPQPVGM